MGKTEARRASSHANGMEEPTVEGLLERLGGFSWFQLFACFVTISPEITAAMISLSPVLTGSNHFCSNGTNYYNNSTVGCVKTSSFPGGLKSVVQEFGLVGRKAWISDMFTSFQMCGAFFGALTAGHFAERYGRKKAHFTLCFLMGAFGLGSGWAPDPITFCVCRFFAGFAVGGCYVVYLNYLMEFLTPKFRTVCGCVSLWCVGEMLLALVGYLLQGWRQILWATSAPVFLVFLAYPWMPESPRFLLCQGRTQDAMEVFDQIARWNGKPLVDPSEIKAIQKTILEGDDESGGEIETRSSSNNSLSTSANTEDSIKNKRERGWLCRTVLAFSSSFKIFGYKKYRLQLIILMFSWFTSQLIFYGLTFNLKNMSGDPYLNVLFMGIVGLPGSFTGLLFNNRLGRRTTIIGFFTISFCLLMVVIAIDEATKLLDENPTIIVFFCLFVRLFVSAGFAVLSCFTAESFPTVVRVSCMGICAIAGNIGGILAPQFVYVSTIFKSTQYMTFGLFSFLTIIGACHLEEMKGRPLEDQLGPKKNPNERSCEEIVIRND